MKSGRNTHDCQTTDTIIDHGPQARSRPGHTEAGSKTALFCFRRGMPTIVELRRTNNLRAWKEIVKNILSRPPKHLTDERCERFPADAQPIRGLATEMDANESEAMQSRIDAKATS